MKNTTQAESSGTRRSLADPTDSDIFDRRLFEADARVNHAHCDALFHAGILTRVEADRIKNGLRAIAKRAEYDANYFDELPAPDVHRFAENRLVQLVGDAALKLNVGRSRADHAATVFRLWLREEIEDVTRLARAVQTAVVASAERQPDAVLPGSRRNGETVPPILWAHWCLAYFERLARSRERFDEVWRRVNVMPLGSGLSAGTNFEIDREETARNLGFEGVSSNSLDAVSDDDYAAEFVHACALSLKHLTRLADDLTALASDERRFVELSLDTDTNYPPQHNDTLRFIGSRAARVFGHQAALFARLNDSSTLWGEDFGLIERAVFDTVDATKICLRISRRTLENARVREESSRGAPLKNHQIVRELADYLLHKNVPYQTACRTVEKIYAFAASNEIQIDKMNLNDLRKFSGDIEADVFEALSLKQALAGKAQIGGTAPERVFDALAAARAALEMEEQSRL